MIDVIYIYLYILFYMHSDYTEPSNKTVSGGGDFRKSATECVGVKERRMDVRG